MTKFRAGDFDSWMVCEFVSKFQCHIIVGTLGRRRSSMDSPSAAITLGQGSTFTYQVCSCYFCILSTLETAVV